MILSLLKKDWTLLWPIAGLVTAIQIACEWASYRLDSPGAAALLHPLTLAWQLGIAALAAAAVLQDPLAGADQDWLIRPLRRSDLLLAKLAFVASAVSAPMFALNLAHAMALGLPLAHSLAVVFYKETYVLASFILPVMALAATTRNMTELIVLGALLVVVYALSVGVSALLAGAQWCPTCGSGVSWLQHVLQHIGIFLGAVVVLYLQYYRRRTALARVLAVAGAVALVVVQLPWNTAFAVQTWLSGSSGTTNRITLELGRISPALPAENRSGGSGTAPNARRTTALLLQGRVDRALESLRPRAAASEAPVTLDLAVRVQGLASDEFLLVDRLELRLTGADGRLLYRRANAGVPPDSLVEPQAGASDAAGFTAQSITVPASYRSAASTAEWHAHYSLTLMQAVTEHGMAALDGSLRAPDIGLCSSRLDQDAIVVRCRTIGRAPFCYSATLVGRNGHRNPEVLECSPDYRPYLPALTNVLSYFDVAVPVRDRYGLAHYAVDPSELATAQVLLKIYGERDHFERTLAAPSSVESPRSTQAANP